MAFTNKMALQVKFPTRIFSEQILKRFPDPVDCLTAHLMLECAEVLAGVKPANLISLGNRTQPCGRNLYRLWQSHHEELTARLGDLSIMVLHAKERALLLLCYNKEQLERHLSHAGIRALLHRAGYETTRIILFFAIQMKTNFNIVVRRLQVAANCQLPTPGSMTFDLMHNDTQAKEIQP